MIATIGYYPPGIIALGIILIGAPFLISPHAAAAA